MLASSRILNASGPRTFSLSHIVLGKRAATRRFDEFITASPAPMLVALLVGLVAVAPATHLSADSAEALVRRIQTAVEAGRADTERATWERQRPNDDVGAERRTLALATLDRLTYRDADAEREYAVLLRADSVRNAGFAYGLLGAGALRAQEARLAEAEPFLRRAITALGAAPSAGAATALGTLAIVVSRTVSVDSALHLFNSSMRVVPRGDDWLHAWIACNVLVARVRRADPEVARLARPTADSAVRAGNRRGAAACLAALAQDYERRTMIDSALATFGEVADLQRATRNLSALAVSRQWQGYVLSSVGQFAPARAALTEALALGRQTGTVAAAAWASLGLSDLALTFGDLPASGAYARTASALFARTGDRWGALDARMHEGDVALLNRATGAARAAYEQVARDAPAIAPTNGVHARGRLAFVALFEGDLVDASRQLDSAMALSRALHMNEWRQEDTYARGILALASNKLGVSEEKLRARDRLVAASSPAEHADILTRLAEVHARRGEIARADQDLTEAGAVIDRWRASLPERELRAAAVQARKVDWDRDLGFATTIQLIAKGGRVAAAFRLSEQRRARVLLESMAQRTAFAPEAAAGWPAAAIVDADVRRVLPESTAVLAFVTGRGGEPTTVFVLTRDKLAAVAVDPVDDHMLELERFAALVAAGENPTDLAGRLGKAFVNPALALVPSGITRLVLVPDGPLHRVPFDVLRSGDGEPLVSRYAISLAPSASAVAALWAAPPRDPLPRLLAFGDPVGVALRRDHADIGDGAPDSMPPRLPAAAAEAAQIARYAPVAEVLTGANARESRLRRRSLADVGVLHFATHAQVDQWSLLRSALLLAPGDGEDGRVGVDELVGLRLSANLVVLSACNSGGGVVLGGEGLQGLTEPFLEAGASAVVATLWQIGDRSAAPFVERFYKELAAGISVGDALHRAKRGALDAGVAPSVWAAFTLTGDERVRTALRPPTQVQRATAQQVEQWGGGAALLLVLIAPAYFVSRTKSRRSGERS
jgi:tetratricopeptide (TPR) repeat protein